ncbi:hypothetical protein NUW58_g7968 [Xylaria curta]|uniref:Uncharacterized protein n=1 Tax=Xylaria curta TaxID=42375 RepID=A0ACC1NDK5_9PEZI|nr:hypothetical protein NUW58_g7968 [Xylaria curta]
MEATGYAIVVGGGSGIGRVCALAFAKAGSAGIAIADINIGAAREVAEECRVIMAGGDEHNGSTRATEALQIDVTSETSVNQAMRHVAELRITKSIMAVSEVKPKSVTSQDEGPPTGAEGFITNGFPAADLRRTQRHITGHNANGQSVFLITDCETPIECNGNADMRFARENEPPLYYPNGSVVRMIDFAPGIESPLHRTVSVDYGVVLEGVFQLTLDSGESRIMRPSDVSIQRATAHKWKNITGEGTMPGRMLWVLLPCNDIFVGDKKVEGFLGHLEKEYSR